MNNKSCECQSPKLGAEGYCDRCGYQIDPSIIESLQSKLEGGAFKFDGIETPEISSNKNLKFRNKQNAQNQRSKFVSSDEAARRTLKYATLFEDIGRFSQLLNSIGAAILLIVGFFLDISFGYKFLYWLVILIYWWFSYLNTSLLRGVSSYFQMRASAHLEKK